MPPREGKPRAFPVLCSQHFPGCSSETEGEGGNIGISGRAWLGGEEWGGEALVREWGQEVGWDQEKRQQKQKR